MSDLLTEQKWFGEFFLPGSHENRFSGELQYTPEDGVTLSYFISHNQTMQKSEILHGFLDSGDPCTLIGNFDPSKTGINLNNEALTRPGRGRFQFLILGRFLTDLGKVQKLDLNLTNLQEFFYPSYAKSKIKHSNIPDYNLSTSFGNIKVGTNTQFHPLGRDITEQIYSFQPLALAELQANYRKITEKHGNHAFLIKENINYRLSIDFSTPLSVLDAYKKILLLTDLFSLLTYSPVYPEDIKIHDLSFNNTSSNAALYPSMIADRRTLANATRKQSHTSMPIQRNTIPLEQIISNWLSSQYDFSIIVSSIQNDSTIVNLHEAHGEVTLYATQLESISYLAKQKSAKYEYPISTYANQKIVNGLSSAFSVSTISDIGKSIADLRNEIAHVGKPKVILRNLSLKKMVRINKYLQLTVIGYILTQIGVQKDVINNYQDHHAPLG
ncbi:hypothetical protein RN346_04545 [Halomonas sp. PAMB 3232]|uniref:ApeA N-terminal domain 1-containing protein n=1 Tax=Halomonas sp. PAMB 3232 TaxID=3075221 RepID=UPI0028A0021B|nr:HEPN domain-containing protein [Halomonas sp. PAMB 3232]WNL39831.1 hypothetical protein RN346_04545 [Halomonas sp. PAMB 3232]